MPSAAAPPRYDDSVVNLLRLESDKSQVVRVSLYRNLIDLMMQDRASTKGATRTRIFETLSRLHAVVPAQARRDVARRVGQQRQPQPLDLVLWLWTGDPEVSSQMLPTLQLRQSDWQALLPKLPQSALGQLNMRSDLPATVQRALASLGSGGVELESSPMVALSPPVVKPEKAAAEISALPTQTLSVTALEVNSSPEENNPEREPLELTTLHSEPELSVDWSQLRKGRPRDSNHLETVARIIFVTPPENVIASNDDAPSPAERGLGTVETAAPVILESLISEALILESLNPVPNEAPLKENNISADVQVLSEEAQVQIRDLIQRIADFRRRWIDRPGVDSAPNFPARDTQLSEIADVIHAEMELAGYELDGTPVSPVTEISASEIDDDIFEPSMMDEIIDAPEHTALPENQFAADDSALLLSDSVAYRLPPVQPQANAPYTPSNAEIAASLADWQWESDRAGRFLQAQATSTDQNLPGGLFSGLRGSSLVSLFADTAHMVVSRALERRSAFRDIEFYHGDGPLAGRWWVSGVAVFDVRTGLYLGHRGVARRVDVPAAAKKSDTVPAVTIETTELLSTLAHETRTPLNAIMGFAQMIDAQTWGAVPAPYAPHAVGILQESQKLLQALDDVTDTHRLKRGVFELHKAPFDPGQVIAHVLGDQHTQALGHNMHLLSRIYPGLPMLWSDRDALERALGRLLVVAITQALPGEAVMASVRALAGDEVCFSISRITLRLDGEIEPSSLARTDVAVPTGTSFAMRFVEQLVTSLGGRLEASPRRFDLIIPAAMPADSAGAESLPLRSR